eukprot:scaffold510798_cov50-Prasinocladus_malaysianus.AAC.1
MPGNLNFQRRHLLHYLCLWRGREVVMGRSCPSDGNNDDVLGVVLSCGVSKKQPTFCLFADLRAMGAPQWLLLRGVHSECIHGHRSHWPFSRKWSLVSKPPHLHCMAEMALIRRHQPK